MRKWINLFEDARVKDKTKADFDVRVAPGSAGDLVATRSDRTPVTALPGKTASREKSMTATKRGLDHQSKDFLKSLHASLRGTVDVPPAAPSVIEPEPEPEIENLPMVITQALQAGGDPEINANFNPTWHQVKNLPGYMQSAIRAMGRMVFAPFTQTPVEDIQVMASLVNPQRDVDRMASWIERHGVRDDAAELKFTEIMPGYQAQVAVYNLDGYMFILVRDQMGHYIYGMNGGRGTSLTGPSMPRLESMDEGARARLLDLANLGYTTPLETAYRQFMEGPNDPVSFVKSAVKSDGQGGFTDDQGNAVDADGNAVEAQPGQANTSMPQKPQGSGQSNSTIKPGQQNPGGLTPAQQQAKNQMAAKTAAANKPM